MNKNIGYSGHVFLRQPYLDKGQFFQFQHVNNTVTDYAMAMLFFKKKISVTHYFYVISLFSISGIHGKNLYFFIEACHSFTFCHRTISFGTQKYLKKQRYPKCTFIINYARKLAYILLYEGQNYLRDKSGF